MAYILYPDGETRRQFASSYLRDAIKGPGWIHSDRYAVEAKAEGTASQFVMKGPMLQRLLQERLKLQVPRESLAVPAYTLTLRGANVKLQESQQGGCFQVDIDRPSVPEPGKPPCGMVRRTTDGFDLRGTTIENLCLVLSTLVDRKVIDQTGLKGTYDLRLDMPQELQVGAPVLATPPETPGSQNHLSNDPGAAFVALRKLRLKLDATNGAVELLIIDHVEKPSEN
jgi:uncharacterized protein (TIGR03435 family)